MYVLWALFHCLPATLFGQFYDACTVICRWLLLDIKGLIHLWIWALFGVLRNSNCKLSLWMHVSHIAQCLPLHRVVSKFTAVWCADWRFVSTMYKFCTLVAELITSVMPSNSPSLCTTSPVWCGPTPLHCALVLLYLLYRSVQTYIVLCCVLILVVSTG